MDGKHARTETHAHVLRWYLHDEAVMMLERAGFEDVTTYGDYTDGPATKDSSSVIYGARRPQA